MSVGDTRAYTGDLQECWNGGGVCEDNIVQDGVAKDHESGFAGLGGFCFAPGADVGFEEFLFGCVGRGGLFTFGFQRGFGRPCGCGCARGFAS